MAEQTGTGDVLHAVVDGQRFVLRMRAVEGLYVLVGATEIVGDVVLYIPVGVGIVGHEEVHSVAVGREKAEGGTEVGVGEEGVAQGTGFVGGAESGDVYKDQAAGLEQRGGAAVGEHAAGADEGQGFAGEFAAGTAFAHLTGDAGELLAAGDKLIELLEADAAAGLEGASYGFTFFVGVG